MSLITVRIKTWDEMEREFGLYSSGHIKCGYVFTSAMKYLCNTLHKVEIDSYSNTVDEIDGCSISSDMYHIVASEPTIRILKDYSL